MKLEFFFGNTKSPAEIRRFRLKKLYFSETLWKLI